MLPALQAELHELYVILSAGGALVQLGAAEQEDAEGMGAEMDAVEDIVEAEVAVTAVVLPVGMGRVLNTWSRISSKVVRSRSSRDGVITLRLAIWLVSVACWSFAIEISALPSFA